MTEWTRNNYQSMHMSEHTWHKVFLKIVPSAVMGKKATTSSCTFRSGSTKKNKTACIWNRSIYKKGSSYQPAVKSKARYSCAVKWVQVFIGVCIRGERKLCRCGKRLAAMVTIKTSAGVAPDDILREQARWPYILLNTSEKGCKFWRWNLKETSRGIRHKRGSWPPKDVDMSTKNISNFQIEV